VSGDLLLSSGRIFGSVALLAVVMFVTTRVAKAAKLDPELSRKLIHISLGLYCLTFPWIFDSALDVLATCALACGVFLLARGVLRSKLGDGLHGVNRRSWGEVLFAASVALLFWLKDGTYINEAQGEASPGPILYVLPILTLTLCDAASALVGSRYGQTRFRIEDGLKSIEGVVAFALTAWLCSLIALLLLTDIGRGEVVLLAFITAVFGALLEAASWRGLDNLFIPLGLYFLLANLLHLGVPGLAAVAAVFFLVLLGLMDLTRRAGADRHFIATAATLFFCIAIFSGIESVITPALAVGAYLACRRLTKVERPEHDALNLLLVVLSLALAFFVASNIASVDTIYAFNLAFAGLAAGIVARFGASLLAVVGIVIVGVLAMSVRTLWMEGASEVAWWYTGLGVVGVVIVAVTGGMIRGRKLRPWLTLGGIALTVGIASIPASP
jgi:phytol kinase